MATYRLKIRYWIIMLLCIFTILFRFFHGYIFFASTHVSSLNTSQLQEPHPPETLKHHANKAEHVESPDGQITSLLQRHQDYVVPNIVHYVWFGENNPLSFHQMLSFNSVHKLIRPEIIYIHCDHEPVGHWWKYIRNLVKTLRVVHRAPPLSIYGNDVILPEHKSDIARLEILMEYGGIYLDFDVIALKSFAELRHYNMTLGLEYFGHPGRLNNGIIIANKNAEFLKIWYDSYRDFSKREWDYHDSIVPYHLQFRYPELIHVEEKTLNYPGGKQLHLIYETIFNWHENYALHLWHRLYEFEHNPLDIKTLNTSFGQIARFIYYGNPDLMT